MTHAESPPPNLHNEAEMHTGIQKWRWGEKMQRRKVNASINKINNKLK